MEANTAAPEKIRKNEEITEVSSNSKLPVITVVVNLYAQNIHFNRFETRKLPNIELWIVNIGE
jgi:hypothetical protein